MNDRAISLLEQYDIEVLKTRKGRGAFICDTRQGSVILKEYSGNLQRLPLQQQVLQRIKEIGLVKAEELIATRDGQLYVKDHEGACYILKTYYEGSECNIYDVRECVEAVQQLARLHHSMDGGLLQPETETKEEWMHLTNYMPLKEYEKHNRELNRVWSYLKKKGQKQLFERRLLGEMEYFSDQARQVTDSWRQWVCDSLPLSICHGDYQYHNIIRTQEGWRILNFEKVMFDNPVRDLYLFLRKVMEKNNWLISLGEELLAAYQAIRHLDELSERELYYRFAYPEKFWKIVNFYYNSGKAWIPEKNLEKLEKVIFQETEKQNFLKAVFQEKDGAGFDASIKAAETGKTYETPT